MKSSLALALILSLCLPVGGSELQLTPTDHLKELQTQFVNLNNRIERALLAARFKPEVWIENNNGPYLRYQTREKALEEMRDRHMKEANDLDALLARKDSDKRWFDAVAELRIVRYESHLKRTTKRLDAVVSATPQKP